MLGFFRNHVVSYHCEATVWNGTSHATLLIIYVANDTNYYFIWSEPVQLYAKHTKIFIYVIYQEITKGPKSNQLDKGKRQALKDIFSRSCLSQWGSQDYFSAIVS